jgi:hypothetical protein
MPTHVWPCTAPLHTIKAQSKPGAQGTRLLAAASAGQRVALVAGVQERTAPDWAQPQQNKLGQQVQITVSQHSSD